MFRIIQSLFLPPPRFSSSDDNQLLRFVFIVQFLFRHFAFFIAFARIHSKNWSVKNNTGSVIFNTSQECEEGQHSKCYTNTSGGVAILTLRKCYRDLTIRSVALTLPDSYFDTLVSVALTLPEGCCDTLVTPSTGRLTLTGCFDISHGFFENWWCRVKH